jgi:dipeptide/tripeptide permease
MRMLCCGPAQPGRGVIVVHAHPGSDPRVQETLMAEDTAKFPNVFWSANVTELFERAAYYSMASFLVIYLGQIGLGAYWPSNLNGVLWTLVYFLPILSGTIADQVGFRRSLLVAFVLLAAGYTLMGAPVWFGGAALSPVIHKEFTASPGLIATVLAAILLIGVGGSVIKPCISGTMQKSAGARVTLGFAIFYMIINIGSLAGRGVAFVVRTGSTLLTTLAVVGICGLIAGALILLVYRSVESAKPGNRAWTALPFAGLIIGGGLAIAWLLRNAPPAARSGAGLSYIFAVAAVASIVAFFVVLFFYREPELAATTPARPRRSMGRILLDMVLVLRNGRFSIFLAVMSGFWFLYTQVYNVLPLYAKRVVETSPAMDLYTAANPFVIVTFQLLVTALFGKVRAIRSMVIGTVIIGLSMAINLFPIYSAGGVRLLAAHWLPIGSVFLILTVAMIAFGELFTSARMYEYIGALAPKGQEGLFLGYASLPVAVGSLTGNPVGALIFNEIMARDATVRPDGLLELVPRNNAMGWIILMAIGFASALAMWLFNRWLEKHPEPAAAAVQA